jgi:exosortase
MAILPLTLVALWLQLFWSLVPIWRDGEYYAYGWFVGPIALAFAGRRWQMAKGERPSPNPGAVDEIGFAAGAALFLCILLVLPLRMISETDPGWRPPLMLHAALIVAVTHWLLWMARGRALSLSLLPVTIFALTAVPLPWQLEQGLVRRLTGTVIGLTHEIFLLLGRPVEISGERLTMGAEIVEVTDGCSGIRSLQSLGMAALFFGELLLLTWTRRLVLLMAAAACAVIVNTLRAWTLAQIQFSNGKSAADAAHDMVGHVAFATSAGFLFGVAWLLQRRRKRPVVVKRIQKSLPSRGDGVSDLNSPPLNPSSES